MKKIIFIFLVAAASLNLTSCLDYLTVIPETEVSDNYYRDEASVRRNTASLYGKVWYDFNVHFMWMAGDELAGDLYYTHEEEGHFYLNQVTASNKFSNDGWIGLYRVVSFANSIINDMPPLARGNGVAESVIEQALAEARFARGVAYYFLAEYWGDVPVVDNSTELISNNKLYVPRHTRGSVYRFICEDLEYAAGILKETDAQPGRPTKWSAYGFLAKVYVTRASDFGNVYSTSEEREQWFASARNYAGELIENIGWGLYPDYGRLFDADTNNNQESLFAMQCMTGAYGLGNARTTAWTRSTAIADVCWGAGKGPTLSLQEAYSSLDKRRKWVFMTAGDHYPDLDKENGGYTYHYTVRDPEDLSMYYKNQAANGMLAHIKKYCIGKSADNGGATDGNQNAANNVYFLRLADVYMLYVEAAIGTGAETSDARALEYFRKVRERAGLDYGSATISYTELIRERRREFAFEGMNWLDVKRYFYRDQTAALAYLNGMERDRIYEMDWDVFNGAGDDASKYVIENDKSNYKTTYQVTDAAGNRVPLTVAASQMYLPIPAEAVTKAPILKEPAVDYYNR